MKKVNMKYKYLPFNSLLSRSDKLAYFRRGKRGSIRENIRIFGPVLLIVMLLLVGLKLWAGRNASAAWFDTNWAFRQKIALSNTTGTTQTSFQVQVTIDTATLITAGKLQS